MRPAKVPALSLVILAVSVLLLLPAAASDSDAAGGDVVLVLYDTNLEISAGSSDSFKVEAVNTLSYSVNKIDNHRMVSIGFAAETDLAFTIDKNDKDFVLEGQEHRSINITVSVGKYVASGTYNIGITLTVKPLQENSAAVTTDPVSLGLVVLSPLSSGNSYNKILEVFDNPLPAPFDGPLTTAAITFALWVIIGILAMIVIMPLFFRKFEINHKEESRKLKRGLRISIPLVLILFAFDKALRVYGAPTEIVGAAETVFDLLYILLGAVLAWMVYLVFVQRTVSKISQNKRIDQRDVDVEPLLRLLGKLVISVTAVASIMSTWGFDLTAIITSAGIVSLGITLGAQNILNQFFSGMVLLLTHPFKSGDLVKIGDSNTIYKVSNVNIMNTVFENWDNEETVIMPNNAVSSSMIVNMTGDGLIYKVTLQVKIAYDNDIDLARSLMKEAAMEHPNIITNSSVDLPSTRVTAFLDSSIELRLTSYVYDFNDSGRITGELREAIFRSFKKNGITIPFPQMDVHLDVVRRDDLQKGPDD